MVKGRDVDGKVRDKGKGTEGTLKANNKAFLENNTLLRGVSYWVSKGR